MISTEKDLATESDVEQKFIWPLLTTSEPDGLGFSPAEVATKVNLRRLRIDKGNNARLYYPDYVVLIGGMPVLVVEAKAPGEDPQDGYREARLYATEINALYPAGINPCTTVIATNGRQLLMGSWDAEPSCVLPASRAVSSSELFAQVLSATSRSAKSSHVQALRGQLGSQKRFRPTSLMGGQSVRNEEFGQNSFGASLTLDFRHIFNPSSQADRIAIATHGYVSSKRRERYVEPIDKLIHHALPGLSHIKAIEDSATPAEMTRALSRGKTLENEVMLLVGSVGSGKTTFVDYLAHVALPEETRRKTLWTRLDMNTAPLDPSRIYEWVTEHLITQMRDSSPQIDFDEIETIKRLYEPELRSLQKGALALLDANSSEYRTRLADEILSLQKNLHKTCAAYVRYLCERTQRLLVVVFDNSDKRIRDEQLLLFQVAQWIQKQLRCLVLLPIRDVTYELYRSEPPLDTALKDLVFRIEPPMFSKVLEKRVWMALAEMKKGTPRTLSYTLPNNIRVEYPASDQGMYLASLLRSLHAHDRFVRRVVTGLAGRDVRKAMEIFLEFCSSGHIGEDAIFQIRNSQGNYTLDFPTVARVLLRMNRRFYDGDHSYLKNIFQCPKEDPIPDHFLRAAVLGWLSDRLKKKGPSNMTGFHRVTDLLGDMVASGHRLESSREALLYLVRSGCVVAEHQRTDKLADEDLIRLSPAGSVHLTLGDEVTYLAACAEDIWYADEKSAAQVAQRIGSSAQDHYREGTAMLNALTLAKYLQDHRPENLAVGESVLEKKPVSDSLDRLVNSVSLGSLTHHAREVFVGNLHYDVSEDELREHLNGLGVSPKSLSAPPPPPGRSNPGFAFLHFADATTAATAALALSGTRLRGRTLAANPNTKRKS